MKKLEETKTSKVSAKLKTDWTEENSNVAHLDNETFETFLEKKKHVLVMFHTPWCSYCNKIKPDFTNAAKKFENDPNVSFAAVNCDMHEDLCSANRIRNYPTLKYYNYLKTEKPYRGAKTEEDFIRFMTNPMDGTSAKSKEESKVESENVIVLNDKSFKEHIASKEIVLVLFYTTWCGRCKKMKPDYMKAADEFKAEGVPCKLTMVDCQESPLLSEEYEISDLPTLKVFKSGKFLEDYKGKYTTEEMKKYVNTIIKTDKDKGNQKEKEVKNKEKDQEKEEKNKEKDKGKDKK